MRPDVVPLSCLTWCAPLYCLSVHLRRGERVRQYFIEASQQECTTEKGKTYRDKCTSTMSPNNPAVLRICGNTIYRHHLLYAGSVAAVGLGFATFLALPTPLPQESPRIHPEALAGRDRAEKILHLVHHLPDKTRRQKVDAGFNAAVKTHKIGFPTDSASE